MSTPFGNFFTTPHGQTKLTFVPYKPSSAKSNPTTTKRKAKSVALEHKSSDGKENKHRVGVKDMGILSGPTPELPYISHVELRTLLATAESGSLLNNEVIHAGAAALDQDRDRCEVGDKASIMEEEHDLADNTKANEPADFFAVDSPPGDSAILVDDVTITEHCLSTSINRDVGRPQSHQDIGCQSPGDEDYQRVTHRESGDHDTSNPTIYDTRSHTADMPTPDSCNNAAASTTLGLDKRLPSFPGTSNCAAKSPDCRLQSDQEDSSLEVCTVPDRAKLSPILTADANVSGFQSNCNREPTLSIGTASFDVNGRAGSALESEARQELLRSTDGSIPFSEAADQDVTSVLTDSRNESKQGEFHSTDCFRGESGVLDGDEEDRYQVEQIMDHDELGNWIRYHVKWLGWPEEDMTWEPESNLDDCEELLKEYWASVRAAPRYKPPKRKLPQDDQGFSDEDVKDLDGYSDAGVRIRVRRGEGGGQRSTSKPREKRRRTRK